MKAAVSRAFFLAAVSGAAASFAVADVSVFPTGPHAAHNFIPLAPGTAAAPVNNSTMHQVFASSLFASASGGLPVQISDISFAPNLAGTYTSNVTIRLGYTNAIPGQGSAGGGLAIPTAGGGGTPNATGAMTTFFSNPTYVAVLTGSSTTNFEVHFPGNFVYNPALGNLLVEVVCTADLTGNVDLAVSRAAGSTESSRSYVTDRFGSAESPTTASRMQFTYTVQGGVTGACCRPDGTCFEASQAFCTTSGGVYQGDGTTCGTVNCPQPPTGACCLTSGCTILTQAQCTAQNGTYQGNNTTCSTAGCPIPCPPISGAIGGPSVGWPSTHGTQNGRLFRDGIPDTCALSAAGGAPIAGSFAYDKYDFVNTSANPACINVDINTACTGTNFIYAGAYVGAYDPNNPTTNNVASCGGSPNPTAVMSFNVPGGAAFSIVFAEVTAGAGCPNYTFQLSGGALNCNTTACYANCDGSTALPFLNVNDFICFQQKFAAGDSYANCDGSTTAPVLNVNDFICFQTKFAAGCSAP